MNSLTLVLHRLILATIHMILVRAQKVMDTMSWFNHKPCR